MSLWWAKREQLDEHQSALIEDLDLNGRYLIMGPPGSGKTNVLLRRAQFVRLQQMPNVMVLTFTRALTEFVKTGCYVEGKGEIFPPKLITTFDSWFKSLYRANQQTPPNDPDPMERRRKVALGAQQLASSGRIPKYDALFIDEAQDLLAEEVAAIATYADNLFFVGDDRQKLYDGASGLDGIRNIAPPPEEHTLPFHYRLVRKICLMADRIQVATGGKSLADTSHYVGPTPGRIDDHALSRAGQIEKAIATLKDQVRVYGDMIASGDRLGVIVPRKRDREIVLNALEATAELRGRSQVVRARSGDQDDDHDTALDPNKPILIVTAQGSKGLEFRAVQWLFSDDLEGLYTPELYYTVVTRAKTSLDIYYETSMAEQIAKAYAPEDKDIW